MAEQTKTTNDLNRGRVQGRQRKVGSNPETVKQWLDKEGGHWDESGQQAKQSPRQKTGYDTKTS